MSGESGGEWVAAGFVLVVFVMGFVQKFFERK